MFHKAKKKEQSHKIENVNQVNNAPLQQNNSLNNIEEAEFMEAHNKLVSALKMDEGKKKISEKNKFAMGSDEGFAAIYSRVKQEQKSIDSIIENVKAGRKEFTTGEGGIEFTALKNALLKLEASEAAKETDQEIMEQNYIEVEKAATAYVETHDRHHNTLQGRRRFKFASALADHIRNMDYLKERQISLKKEVTFAKQDARGKYVKGDKILNVSPISDNLSDQNKNALKFYSGEQVVISEEDYKAGVHIGPFHKYNPYQFINGIRRGLIKKEEVTQLREGVWKKTLKLGPQSRGFIENAIEMNEQMDHVFDDNHGLMSTSKVYRGIGTEQMKNMLNLPPDADLTDMDTIAQKLESLVGKVLYDGGFVSTSRERKCAEGFAIKGDRPLGMMLEIVAREGSPMVDISQISQYKGEKEQLLKDGTKMLIRGFKIRHVKDRDGKVKPLIVLNAEIQKSNN